MVQTLIIVLAALALAAAAAIAWQEANARSIRPPSRRRAPRVRRRSLRSPFVRAAPLIRLRQSTSASASTPNHHGDATPVRPNGNGAPRQRHRARQYPVARSGRALPALNTIVLPAMAGFAWSDRHVAAGADHHRRVMVRRQPGHSRCGTSGSRLLISSSVSLLLS